MDTWRNKVAVIVGASSGIGRATAHCLARQGASLVLAARRSDPLAALVDECVALGGQAVAVPTDVTNEQSVAELGAAAIREFGGFDVWINDAGVGSYGLFEQTPPDAFRRVIETDFFGCVNGSRAALEHFRAQGRGVLIQVDSVAGVISQPYAAAYVAAKHALRAFSDSLRQELWLSGHKDIAVCVVLPASIDTPFFQHAANFTGRKVQPMQPVYRPEQVARAISRLALRPARQRYVGGSGPVMRALRIVAPSLADRMFARRVERGHLAGAEARSPSRGTLFTSVDDRMATVTGGWRGNGQRIAPAAGVALAMLPLVGAVAWMGRRPRSRRARAMKWARAKVRQVKDVQTLATAAVMVARMAKKVSPPVTEGPVAEGPVAAGREQGSPLTPGAMRGGGAETLSTGSPPVAERQGMVPAPGTDEKAPKTVGNDPAGWIP